MDHIISLYKEEIETYKQQIVELRQRNRSCDDKNATLINKIRGLEDIIEKANVANKDLNTAFEHVREENLRLQLRSSSQDQQPAPQAITHNEKVESKAIEQYATLAQESLTWISERDKMNQRIKFLERECSRYHRDNTTLGKQVRHLLRSLEEERGMIIRHQSQIPEDQRVVNAADVIDKHLVTFESIEELQQQNQKLLTLVKNLSAEQEEREVQFESEEVKKLNSQLEELQGQLDTIKNDRERVLSALNTIHKERDLFKILLCKTRQVEHMTPEIFQRMVSVACASGPAITDKTEVATERMERLKDLKEMTAKIEAQLVQAKAELEDSKSLSAQELKLKNELIEKAHAKIIEETKRADVLNERNEVLEGNIRALTTEFDEVRTKCNKMTFEYEEIKKKNEELTGAIELAEKVKDELNKSIADEKNRYQEVLVEASQMKEQNQQISEALERERQHNLDIITELNQLREQNQQVIESLERERQRNHEAFTQVSEFKAQTQRMLESFEQERHVRQQEMSALIQTIQDNKRVEAEMGSLSQQSQSQIQQQLNTARYELTQARGELSRLQEQLTKAQQELAKAQEKVTKSDAEIPKISEMLSATRAQLLKAEANIIAFQELRNIERDRRLRLERSLRSVKRDSCTPNNHGYVIMKKTVRKRARIAQPYRDNSMQDDGLAVNSDYPSVSPSRLSSSVDQSLQLDTLQPAVVQPDYTIEQQDETFLQGDTYHEENFDLREESVEGNQEEILNDTVVDQTIIDQNNETMSHQENSTQHQLPIDSHQQGYEQHQPEQLRETNQQPHQEPHQDPQPTQVIRLKRRNFS